MNPNGTLRELMLGETPKPDEIEVPAADVEEIRRWPRARRAWYRDQARKLESKGAGS